MLHKFDNSSKKEMKMIKKQAARWKTNVNKVYVNIKSHFLLWLIPTVRENKDKKLSVEHTPKYF